MPAVVPAGTALLAVEVSAPAGGVLASGSVGDPVEPHGYFLSDRCGLGGLTAPVARTSGFILTMRGTRCPVHLDATRCPPANGVPPDNASR